MIRSTLFRHPQPYRLETHSEKIEQLCTGVLQPLGKFLEEVHSSCPEDVFFRGPRSSKLKYDCPIELAESHDHRRCRDAALGLDVMADLEDTAHSRVQAYMLQTDADTVAVEIPVWAHPDEYSDWSELTEEDGPLSGHIDLVAVEAGKVWVWDYKPNAARERFAGLQILCYAVMLSTRSGVALEHFQCGYFDSSDCYVFSPQRTWLTSLTPPVSRRRRKGQPTSPGGVPGGGVKPPEENPAAG